MSQAWGTHPSIWTNSSMWGKSARIKYLISLSIFSEIQGESTKLHTPQDAIVSHFRSVETEFLGLRGRVRAALEYKVNRIYWSYWEFISTLSLATGQRAESFAFLADACFDRGEVGTKIGDSSQEIAPAPHPPNCEQWVQGYAAKVWLSHFSSAFIYCLNELLTSSFPHSLDGTAYGQICDFVLCSKYSVETFITNEWCK